MRQHEQLQHSKALRRSQAVQKVSRCVCPTVQECHEPHRCSLAAAQLCDFSLSAAVRSTRDLTPHC